MMLIGWLPSLAHHFEINGVFYNVISTTEVEVTYKGSSYDDYDEYNGSVVIPSLVEYGGFTYSVTSIGDDAFFKCTSLTSIEIPYSVTSIGNHAFYNCESLTSIEIPNSVTSIGEWAFYNCSSLTSIEIPDSVTSIGEGAFKFCSSLTSIEIPNSVTSIGELAFGYCSSLTDVVIGNSVTSIGDDAFGYCSSLTNIVVDSGNTIYDSRNGCNAIIETASNTLITGCQNTIIPKSVTSIGEGAFKFCSSLTSIEIPNSVTSIGEWAFEYCSSLTSIEIPNSVTSIGYGAFHECPGLTSIVVDSGNTIYDSRNGCNAIIETTSNTLITGCQNTIIPNSVTSIGVGAFYKCDSLTSIEIPNSVTSIGDLAFYECTSLTRIICTATTPPTIESDTFSEYSAFLFVPIGCKATYEVADYWENFNNIIEVTLDAPVTLNDNDAIVATIGDNIVVKNATVGSVVRIYAADGALIASEVATDGDVVVEAPVKGVYVVTVGKQTVKVII